MKHIKKTTSHKNVTTNKIVKYTHIKKILHERSFIAHSFTLITSIVDNPKIRNTAASTRQNDITIKYVIYTRDVCCHSPRSKVVKMFIFVLNAIVSTDRIRCCEDINYKIVDRGKKLRSFV